MTGFSAEPNGLGVAVQLQCRAFALLRCARASVGLLHAACLVQAYMPAQRLAEVVGGMSAQQAGGAEVVIEGRAVVWVYALINNHPGPLSWREAPQVSQAVLSDQNIHVVLCVVDVADHGHYA